MRRSLFLASLLWPFATRAAVTYVPAKFNPTTARMVVVIHGCLQSAEAMVEGAGWNRLADLNNLLVYYPQVPVGTNPMNCWNWFLPENQRPDSGQLFEIHQEVLKVKSNYQIKDAPTFVTGISSGGAMVSGLLACFPEDYQAGAVHSGASYALAQDLAEGQRVLKEGPPAPSQVQRPCSPAKFKGSLLAIHGTDDKVVNPLHAMRLITDFVPDGVPQPSTRGSENGLDYTVTDYIARGAVRGRVVLVEKLGHAWSGSDLDSSKITAMKLPFFSSEGPSATRLMWEFFNNSPAL